MAYFAPYIDVEGIHMPTYLDRLESLCSSYESIFGVDISLDPSIPDYQLLSVFARALDDTAQFVVESYNSRNPALASGQALDLLLPEYGITRLQGETDAEVRQRMANSLAQRGVNTMDRLTYALLSLYNVRLVKVYVNEEDTEDERGISPHSIAVVIYGGRSAEIPGCIWDHKPPGISTWGSTSANYTDAHGDTHVVKYSRPGPKSVSIIVNVTKIQDFEDEELTGVAGPALANYCSTLPIGEPLIIAQLFGTCYASVPEIAQKFAVLSINVYVNGQLQSNTVPVAWNERISCSPQVGVGFVFH